MLVWLVLGVVALLVLYLITAYNGLVSRRNRVRNAWSQIDVQLKRRHDLIPNLVNAVRGYLQHEREVLQRVVEARGQAVNASGDIAARAAAENGLTRAVGSLFAVAEAYPALKADANVRALQEELASTENRIAFARQHYNDSVMDYNTARETFPRSLIAGPFGFAAERSFEIDVASERAVPTVSL